MSLQLFETTMGAVDACSPEKSEMTKTTVEPSVGDWSATIQQYTNIWIVPTRRVPAGAAVPPNS